MPGAIYVCRATEMIIIEGCFVAAKNAIKADLFAGGPQRWSSYFSLIWDYCTIPNLLSYFGLTPHLLQYIIATGLSMLMNILGSGNVLTAS